MVLLIHGEDTLSSRNFYNSFKDINSISFDAADLSLVELSQTLTGSNLFKDTTKIFIDNLFSNKIKNQEEIIDLLSKNSRASVYIYSNKEVSGEKVIGGKNG